jgi:hypothetical protein
MITENVLVFFVTLAAVVLGIVIWKKFKPKGWNLPEFTYKEESAHAAPDLPIVDTVTWVTDANIGIQPMVDRGGVGMDVYPKMREHIDIEKYRKFIEKKRSKEDEKNKRRE